MIVSIFNYEFDFILSVGHLKGTLLNVLITEVDMDFVYSYTVYLYTIRLPPKSVLYVGHTFDVDPSLPSVVILSLTLVSSALDSSSCRRRNPRLR